MLYKAYAGSVTNTTAPKCLQRWEWPVPCKADYNDNIWGII